MKVKELISSLSNYDKELYIKVIDWTEKGTESELEITGVQLLERDEEKDFTIVLISCEKGVI